MSFHAFCLAIARQKALKVGANEVRLLHPVLKVSTDGFFFYGEGIAEVLAYEPTKPRESAKRPPPVAPRVEFGLPPEPKSNRDKIQIWTNIIETTVMLM